MTMKKTQDKKRLPPDNVITGSKDDLADFLKKLVAGEVSFKTEKETITSKLMLIKDIIEKLKEPIIEKRITYVILSKVIEDKIGLKVSPQTLRGFCQNQLGFPKLENKIIKKKLATKTEIKSYNAEEKLSKQMNFD
jgi:hypothetical protein